MTIVDFRLAIVDLSYRTKIFTMKCISHKVSKPQRLHKEIQSQEVRSSI
jgi:hypothetical protein